MKPGNKGCQKELFPPSSTTLETKTIRIEKAGAKVKRTGRRRPVMKRMKLRKYRRFSIPEFCESNQHLGRYLLEICKMKFLKSKFKLIRYTPYQKWLSANIMMGTSINGYKFISKILPLPSTATILRYIQSLRSKPGILPRNAEAVRVKVNPINDRERSIFILLDEMSLKEGFKYDIASDKIIGFTDNGKQRSKDHVKHALCVMAIGIIKKWKFPVAFYLIDTIKSNEIKPIITDVIAALQYEGFKVEGITTDQGSNFESCFCKLGASIDKPVININDQTYFVLRDPPHLLKSARNFILDKDVHVPGHGGKASWRHIIQLYETDQKSSLKLVPKLTDKHVYGLKQATKMKVKYAAQVLSHSVAASIEYLVSINKMEPEALATSTYCRRFNDLFDCLNSSSPFDIVKFRRPLTVNSDSSIYIQECLNFLENLQASNSHRKPKFISGFRQSINVVLQLNETLSARGIPYLSTRKLCQDPIEHFFGKIRILSSRPTAYQFTYNYARIASSSLIRAPVSGNCEVLDDHLQETMNFVRYVSYNLKGGL